jgi:hypothetical protein
MFTHPQSTLCPLRVPKDLQNMSQWRLEVSKTLASFLASRLSAGRRYSDVAGLTGRACNRSTYQVLLVTQWQIQPQAAVPQALAAESESRPHPLGNGPKVPLLCTNFSRPSYPFSVTPTSPYTIHQIHAHALYLRIVGEAQNSRTGGRNS